MPVVVLPAGNNTFTPTPQDADYTITQTPPSDGNNTVTLGSGTDQVTFADGNNTLTLADGSDQIILGNGSNTLTLGNGNSQVTVGNGNDTISVGTGSNAIVLGTGIDIVSTKAGNNTVSVAGAAISGDTIHGALSTLDGSTNKLVLTSPGAAMSPVSVFGFQSYQLANGGPNSLTLAEGNFTNLPLGSITVLGGDSGNTINAAALSAAHSVVINGGAGTDQLTGGAGNDRFVFAASNLSADTVSGGAGINTLELATGSGMGTVNALGAANFSGLAVIDVDAGANWLFTSTQAVTDTINLASGAVGEFSGAVSSGQTIAFTAPSGTLKIDTAAQFAGQIDGFQNGDTIDLTGVPFSGGGTATLGSQNVLQVAENSQTFNLKLDPTQDFTGKQFTLSSDGNGGTNVVQFAIPPFSTPPGTTADMILQDTSNGAISIYDIGGNAVTGAGMLGSVGSGWQVVGLGGFNGSDTTDMMLRNGTGLEIFDINNSQMSGPIALGNVGPEFQVSGFGDFSGYANETDMIMRDTAGNLEYYDIKNNQVTAAGSMGNLPTQLQVSGFGDFSGNANETDMMVRDTTTGNFLIEDIQANQIVSTTSLGAVGMEWQVLGFGDFGGNANETDMMLRSTTGNLEYYDIRNNHVVGNGTMGNLPTQLQVAGFGDFSGTANQSDMMVRDTSTGNFQIKDIRANHIVSTTSLGAAGMEWHVAGVASNLFGS